MFDNFEPINDNIFVKVIREPQKTESGIYLPVQVKKSTLVCSVLSIGHRVTQIAKGQSVLVPAAHGIELEDDYKIIKEDAVLGKL